MSTNVSRYLSFSFPAFSLVHFFSSFFFSRLRSLSSLHSSPTSFFACSHPAPWSAISTLGAELPACQPDPFFSLSFISLFLLSACLSSLSFLFVLFLSALPLLFYFATLAALCLLSYLSLLFSFLLLCLSFPLLFLISCSSVFSLSSLALSLSSCFLYFVSLTGTMPSCPNCKNSETEVDEARGTVTCTTCGTVLEDSIIVSEVRSPLLLCYLFPSFFLPSLLSFFGSFFAFFLFYPLFFILSCS